MLHLLRRLSLKPLHSGKNSIWTTFFVGAAEAGGTKTLWKPVTSEAEVTGEVAKNVGGIHQYLFDITIVMTWKDETGENILQKDMEGYLVCTSNALHHYYPVLCTNLEKHPTIHGVNLQIKSSTIRELTLNTCYN